ncbi:hypothetical protein BBO99_00005426 [Phytophthora kernoviae]|uniref:Abnormal spindle-like microcephaly-associated protein ASH domain-containing protein n=1 Tax=Phytophthora kernoviae TaxID=325452 RepID=A0A421F6S4_9STRA|nr:hypothetical protein JM16_005743 [Phytophthora kernoviae]RLN26591.1 hypothetical protein BBI17_005555 [Phytophthora kernoviae]RLN79243.1 hypothetical protein BBO99_00005426 [Phytophthora kernoviae]
MSKKTQRLKPSEILTAFSAAKAHAAKHATSRIVELVNAEDHTSRVSSTVPLHQPLFEPTPAEVWIEEYTPFQTLTIKLRFRNCDTVVRRLKIEPLRSPVFTVRPWDAGNKNVAGKPQRLHGKVAAGMELVFVLEFSPQEVADYAVDLVCCTDRERFLLPVRVRGRFAALDLPDELGFGVCPVKMPSTRVLTVRNVGTRSSSFAFHASENFSVIPLSVSLAQGAAMQMELTFVPPSLESGEGKLEVKDDGGQTAVVQLTGRVVNVDVFLGQPLVEPSATYLSLSSRKTVKICNESEFTLEFSWKSFADAAQEEHERTQLLDELSRMETAEREHLQLQLQETEIYDSGCTQSPFDVRKILETKYKHLRKAALEDSMQFVDSSFSVTPLSGRATRLPLQIRGQGIGPKAKVVYNELLDFGDVFINDEHTRDFTIQNKGEIPAEFELIPLTTPPGTSLNVHPRSGTLEVNAMLKIEVTFCSQALGETFHHICFSMQGSDEQLTARFKANVIPPVFHFDVDQVDFGAVSYSFPQTQTVKLINASKISIKYSLRVPEEASYKQKELELVPANGKLDAYGEQQITIHFTSYNVKVYQYQLVVGVTGVGADLLSIPVPYKTFIRNARSKFQIDQKEGVLMTGESLEFILVANLDDTAVFKDQLYILITEDDYICRVINGKVLVSYTGHPQKDSVELLGDISFPNLAFDTTTIDFGCTLNDTQKAIVMNVTNVSKVDTSFRWVFIEDEKETLPTAIAKKPYIPTNQVFDILPIRGLLKPNESEKIEFVYYGHANRRFKSTVACEIDGGPEYELTLLGEASSLVYKLDKQSLEFGQVLYNKTEDRDFSLLNIGKVPFSFSILADNVARGRMLEVAPTSGKIAPTEKQKILVRLRPGIPEYFEETLILEIAHFQPIPFKIYGCGTFAAVSINLPRENHPASVVRGEAPKWKELKKNAKQNIELGMLNPSKVEARSNQITSNNVLMLAQSDSKATISATYRGNEKNSSIPTMLASPQAKAANQRLGAPGSPLRNAAALSSVAAIDELDVEIEACRLFFADYLLVQELKKADARALRNADPAKSESIEDAESVVLMSGTNEALLSGMKPQKKRGSEVFPFILSQFILDFGNVVVGTHKIKRFSVTNIGHGPASFQLDKNLAITRGFQIEPERVVRLPEKQSVEFTVTFHARKNIEMGLHMAQLPIVIKNGPPCIAMVRALVTVPDISISSESLDFGKIAVSTCHTMFTQLQNASAVPAEWAFKKPMGPLAKATRIALGIDQGENEDIEAGDGFAEALADGHQPLETPDPKPAQTHQAILVVISGIK